MKRRPLVDELPASWRAEEVFALLHERPFSFFLDSGMNPYNLGRYSFIGSDPFLVLKSRGDNLTLLSPKGTVSQKGNPFAALHEILERYRMEPWDSPTPLAGGAVGYFSYDLCHFIERLPSRAVDDLHLPECFVAFYDLVLAFDHIEGKTYIVSSGFPEPDEESRLKRAARRIQETKESLLTQHLISSCPQSAPLKDSVTQNRKGVASTATGLRSNFSHQEYLEAVQTAREYIAAGDIFQVNLSQRFEADLPMAPHQLYQHLRHINPAPFAAYLNFDEVTVVSASPERFLKFKGDRVETRPMKGTRPRGGSAAQDEALAKQLQNSIKDRAENVMIVDLERNDLGRVCRFGTVRVSELCTLEKYATVFQLTSTVEGRLHPGKNRMELLIACFPGGSITGAPKVRAMEIIDELEPTRRSVYTGSIGYLSFSGEMDLNIAIRTILVKDGKAFFQVGGAVTYDSDPEAEYEETMDKAKALFQSLNLSPQSAGAV
ncbi:MAG: aminodeoxychorismate synthase, component I [Chloroflexi bacterium RBG_13_54_8]|nr:MAG: aminodeoxychorismate synthase, component I [Chloroflexi bacterium RBG_13_54_8]